MERAGGRLGHAERLQHPSQPLDDCADIIAQRMVDQPVQAQPGQTGRLCAALRRRRSHQAAGVDAGSARRARVDNRPAPCLPGSILLFVGPDSPARWDPCAALAGAKQSALLETARAEWEHQLRPIVPDCPAVEYVVEQLQPWVVGLWRDV